MERFYQSWCKTKDLISFTVRIKESELFIQSDRDLSIEAVGLLDRYRRILEGYVRKRPEFLKSLNPINDDRMAPDIVKDMIFYSRVADVGPMAGVAGAVAEYVGKDLLKYTDEVIIENGGDIFLSSKKDRNIAIYAGDSVFSGRIGIKIKAKIMPIGVCTSSGTVGHSLSFGKADAVVVVSKSTILADAMATSIANMIKNENDIEMIVSKATKQDEIDGILVIKNDKLGVKGNIELIEI